MKSSSLFALGFAILSPLAHAQFDQAADKAKTQQEIAVAELAELEKKIGPEKAKLGAKLSLLEEELRDLQAKATNAQRIADTQGVEVNQLDRQIASLEDTNSYIQSTMLNEYIRRLEVTLDPAEVPQYKDTIRTALEIVNTEEGVEVDQGEIFRAQLAAIDLSLNRLSSLIGGSIVEGKGVLAGDVLDGKYALLGPNTLFSNGTQGGIVLGVKANSNLPNIYALPEFAPGIATLIETGAARAPVDATGSSRGGDLQAPRALDTNLSLVQEFEAGGWVMPFIVVCLIIGCLIGIFKIITLLAVPKAREADLQTVLREGNKDAALSHAKSLKGPAGELLTAAVEASDDDKEVVEEVIYEVIVKNQPKLEQYLAFVALIAAVAPLLGLLGTVTGMINTFKLITIIGTGDAQGLSSGISEALITTKWGLITAIPTLSLHAFANRIAKGVVASLEQAGVGFINGLSEIRESQNN